MLGASVLAALLAPDSDNNVTYQILPLLLFLLAVSFCWSWSFKTRFAATRLLPRFGTVGCPLHYRIVVKNLSSKTYSGLALLENLADPRPSFEDFVALERAEQRALRSFRFSDSQRSTSFSLVTVKEASVPLIAPNEAAEVRVEFTPLRRGVLRFTEIGRASCRERE